MRCLTDILPAHVFNNALGKMFAQLVAILIN